MKSRSSIAALCAAALIVAFLSSPASAALVVYEGFDAGGTAGSLTGKSGATSVGFDASSSWSSSNDGYETAGLSLGSGANTLKVVGGNALINSFTFSVGLASRPLDVTVPGTAWGSFLASRISGGDDEQDNFHLMVNQSNAGHDNNSEFVISAEEFNSANGGMRGKSLSPSFPNYNVGAPINTGETYLVLFKATNLGGTSGAVSLKTWMLSSTQFDNWKTGGLTEAELDAAAPGAAASQVQQKGSASHTPTFYHRLTSADFLLLQTFKGLHGRFDELRMSNSASGDAGGGLDEVTPLAIPEPGTAVLAGLGALAIASMSHRKKL